MSKCKNCHNDEMLKKLDAQVDEMRQKTEESIAILKSTLVQPQASVMETKIDVNSMKAK